MSPSPSEASVTPAPSADLPVPRSHPLIPGSTKETALINYVDDRILNVTRRYAKSFAADARDRAKDAGYTNFDQVIRDIEPILDIVWISATRKYIHQGSSLASPERAFPGGLTSS